VTLSVEQVMVVVLGLGGIISTLAGVVYRMLVAQLADCKAENATLRTEAKAAVAAKDAEIAEWRKQAQGPARGT
jgi:hypothetical protein